MRASARKAALGHGVVPATEMGVFLVGGPFHDAAEAAGDEEGDVGDGEPVGRDEGVVGEVFYF